MQPFLAPRPTRAMAPAIALLVVLGATHAATAQENVEQRRFFASMGMGFDFNRGDYGETETTTVGSVPVYLKLEWSPVTWRVSIPFVLVDGYVDVIRDRDGAVPTTGSFDETSTEYGIGDTVTSLSYSWYPPLRWLPIIDLTGGVKIPTAGNKLGTGKVDATGSIDVWQMLGPVSVFGGFGYRYKGGKQYQNILIANSGVAWRMTDWINGGLTYQWRESSVGRGDAHDISPYLSIRTGVHTRFGPYAIVGLSQNAPDWGIGGTFTYEF